MLWTKVHLPLVSIYMLSGWIKICCGDKIPKSQWLIMKKIHFSFMEVCLVLGPSRWRSTPWNLLAAVLVGGSPGCGYNDIVNPKGMHVTSLHNSLARASHIVTRALEAQPHHDPGETRGRNNQRTELMVVAVFNSWHLASIQTISRICYHQWKIKLTHFHFIFLELSVAL